MLYSSVHDISTDDTLLSITSLHCCTTTWASGYRHDDKKNILPNDRCHFILVHFTGLIDYSFSKVPFRGVLFNTMSFSGVLFDTLSFGGVLLSTLSFGAALFSTISFAGVLTPGDRIEDICIGNESPEGAESEVQ